MRNFWVIILIFFSTCFVGRHNIVFTIFLIKISLCTGCNKSELLNQTKLHLNLFCKYHNHADIIIIRNLIFNLFLINMSVPFDIKKLIVDLFNILLNYFFYNIANKNIFCWINKIDKIFIKFALIVYLEFKN